MEMTSLLETVRLAKASRTLKVRTEVAEFLVSPLSGQQGGPGISEQR